MKVLTLLLLPLLPLVLAAGCVKSNPPLTLNICTKHCLFDYDGGGPCADNLRGLCEQQDHQPNVIVQWMAYYQECLITYCAVDDQHLYDLLNTFRVQCEQVSRPFPSTMPGENIDDWVTAATRPPYTTRMQTMKGGATATSVAAITTTTNTSSSTSSSSSSIADIETTTWTSEPTTTISDSPPLTSTSNDSSTTIAPSTNVATDHDDSNTDSPAEGTLLISRTTPASRSLASSHSPNNATAPSNSPPLSTAAISGTAAGGAFIFALTVGLIVWLMRRKKNKHVAQPPDYWKPDREPKRPNIHGSMRALPGLVARDVDMPGQYRGIGMEKENSLPIMRGGNASKSHYVHTSHSARAYEPEFDDGRCISDMDTINLASPLPPCRSPPVYELSNSAWGPPVPRSTEKGMSSEAATQQTVELAHNPVFPMPYELGPSTTHPQSAELCGTTITPSASGLGANVAHTHLASERYSTPISPCISELGSGTAHSQPSPALHSDVALSPVSELGTGEFDNNHGPQRPVSQISGSESSIPRWGRHWDRAGAVKSSDLATDGGLGVGRHGGGGGSSMDNIAQNF